MKRILLFIIALITPILALAQPKLSYIIPDIGAPGMNVYVEFIAPYNAKANFGTDGVFLNNPGNDVRVVCANPADEKFITVGPVVVSWNGRLISTQIFVDSDVKPSSWDWQATNIQVPLKVIVNGAESTTETFYVVQPFAFGDKTANTESVLGEGALGKRSKRGAMIVDSMILASKTYTVSTVDCDGATPGNQAYLPFVLLSVGKIEGSGPLSKIAIDGSGKNAGPGGGGGGGKFCDITSTGEDGGAGYTAGGPGGRNASGITSNIIKNEGEGTFVSTTGITHPTGLVTKGFSLNGVPPASRGGYESAGGGTGHPFGLSGLGSYNDEKLGLYGGGSGFTQDKQGGAGGFATDGLGDKKSGGLTHGNVMNVPLAGGSGGASGNPQGTLFNPSVCSGAGGGGGGAIIVFAKNINNVLISSNGADGQNGDYGAHGGAGSGGFIGAYSKLNLNKSGSLYSAIGGKNKNNTFLGGKGRIRYDGVFTPGINNNLADASLVYTGPATDTTSVIRFNDTKTPNINKIFTGYTNPMAVSVVYYKPKNGNWEIYNSNYSGNSFVFKPLIRDTLYYLCIGQLETLSSSDYASVPVQVLSQAAGNILKVQPIPIIDGIKTVTQNVPNCQPINVLIKDTIKNIGTADLILDYQNTAKFKFKYGNLSVGPVSNKTIKPDSTLVVDMVVSVPAGNLSTYMDTLMIPHNDIYGRPNPRMLEVIINILPLQTEKYETIALTKLIDTLNFGSVCVGADDTVRYALKNTSGLTVNFDKMTFPSNTFLTYKLEDSGILPIGKASSISVMLPSSAPLGKTTGKAYIYVQECANPVDSIYYKYDVQKSVLTYVGSGTFPDTRVGVAVEQDIEAKNMGTSNLYIANIPNPGLDFTVVSTVPPLPVTLKPGEKITVKVRFLPNTPGSPLRDTLNIVCPRSDSTCDVSADLSLSGNAVFSQVYVSKYVVDFDSTDVCGSAVSDTVYVGNPKSSTASFKLMSPPTIAGLNPTMFKFALLNKPATYPITLNPGDSVGYVITYSASAGAGYFSAVMSIYTNDLVDKEIKINISGYRDSTNLDVPLPRYVGDVNIGFPQKYTFRIFNYGMFDRTFTKVTPISSFITLKGPQTGVVKAKSFVDYEVEINPTSSSQTSFVIEFAWTPCPISIRWSFDLKPISSSVSVNSPQDYGTLSACEDSLKTVTFKTNSPGAPVVYLGYTITGDNTLFICENASRAQNDTIKPGEQIDFKVRFKPTNSVDGSKQAKFFINIYANGLNVAVPVDLTGVKNSGVIVAPNAVNFGKLKIKSSVDKTVTITNSGAFDIEIVSAILPSGAKCFIASGDPTGKILNPTKNLSMSVKFTPDTNKVYNDTIFIRIKYRGCEEVLPIALSGQGANMCKLYLYAGMVTRVDPTSHNVEIPIWALVKGDVLNSFKIDNITMNMRKTLYAPTKVAPGTMTTTYENSDLFMNLKLGEVNLSEEDKLYKIGTITGEPLLGDVDTTDIKFVSVDLVNKENVEEVITYNGGLSIKVCDKGGSRLLNYSGDALFEIAPNPVTGSATITFNPIEAGTYEVELISVSGAVTVLTQVNVAIGDIGKPITITVDFSTFASGEYTLRLKSPSAFGTRKIIIKK